MSNFIRTRKSRVTAALATAAISLGIVAGPASAQQNRQEGLVNVNVQDVGVIAQVPIGVAANVCGTNVVANVLAQNRNTFQGQNGQVVCNAQNEQLPRAFQQG